MLLSEIEMAYVTHLYTCFERKRMIWNVVELSDAHCLTKKAGINDQLKDACLSRWLKSVNQLLWACLWMDTQHNKLATQSQWQGLNLCCILNFLMTSLVFTVESYVAVKPVENSVVWPSNICKTSAQVGGGVWVCRGKSVCVEWVDVCGSLSPGPCFRQQD